MQPLDHTTKAIDTAREIVRIWADWSDGNEVQSELALRDACKTLRAIDLHQVDGTLSSPLNYFAMAYLDDHNPEDLTICEMVESIEISLAL